MPNSYWWLNGHVAMSTVLVIIDPSSTFQKKNTISQPLPVPILFKLKGQRFFAFFYCHLVILCSVSSIYSRRESFFTKAIRPAEQAVGMRSILTSAVSRLLHGWMSSASGSLQTDVLVRRMDEREWKLNIFCLESLLLAFITCHTVAT